MLKKSRLLLLFAIFLGMLWGIISYDLIVPVQTEPVTPYYHGTRGLNNIALTVNVDWGEEYIPDMLEVLSEYNIKATFFVTGKWVEKNPELLKKIHDKGHEIGNHGYLHLHPADLSPSSLHKLIKKNEDLIYKLTGKQTKLFAPPYGEVNDKIVKSASDIGYKTIMWSADTIDWQRPSPQLIVQRAVNKIDDGGIILMHPTSPSLKALPLIIDKLKKRGFVFVTVSELISN